MAQQQRAEETRTRIVQAGLESFAQNGYDGTGVEETETVLSSPCVPICHVLQHPQQQE